MQYFRNKQDITTQEGEFVESGSLWALDKGLFILEDQDRFATESDKNKFTPATLIS